MKKYAGILVAVAMLGANVAQAQSASQGKAAKASTSAANNDFAWIVGLGGLAVLGVVVGVTAAAATSNPSFNH